MKNITIVTHVYQFDESPEYYFLMLNGGICKGYPKKTFNREAAFTSAQKEVNDAIKFLGCSKVSFSFDDENTTIRDLIKALEMCLKAMPEGNAPCDEARGFAREIIDNIKTN